MDRVIVADGHHRSTLLPQTSPLFNHCQLLPYPHHNHHAQQHSSHSSQPIIPSVSFALPPVGVQSTVWQLGHSTTVCEWLNTVVLWERGKAGDCERCFANHDCTANIITITTTHPPQTTIHLHVEAALAFDVHKVRVGRLYQALELVLALLLLGRRVEEINIACEHL